jgi:hypothetical protein
MYFFIYHFVEYSSYLYNKCFEAKMGRNQILPHF